MKLDRSPQTNVLQMRIMPELYEELRQDAAKHGRSISAQAERRLLHREPDASDVGRMIGMVIDAAERREGKPWNKDDQMMLLCLSASLQTLGIVFGGSTAGTLVQTALKDSMDRMSDAAAGKTRDGVKPSAEDGARATKEFQPTSDGVHLADEVHGKLLEAAFDEGGR